MRLLLDTHIAIWAVIEPARLSRDERALLEGASAEAYVSVASLWEIAIKFALAESRRQRPAIPFCAREAKGHFEDAGFQFLAIALEHVLELERLPAHHGDPFDRLIVAQAKAEPMRLLSHDPRVCAYLD
jgi:PIN domain nuclease of toxin-antitoxin system